MTFAGFLMDDNADKTSPQTSTLRFRNSAREVSDFITTICTEHYQHTLVPNNHFWFKIEDVGAGGTLHGYLYKGPEKVMSLQTAPITSCVTAAGDKIMTLLEMTREPAKNSPDVYDLSIPGMAELALDDVMRELAEPACHHTRHDLADLSAYHPPVGSRPN